MKKARAVKKTEIAITTGSPAEMIRQAVLSGGDLDKLEKLLGLQERWEANEAKKAYHRAMTAFKLNPPEIEKDKKVAYDSGKGKVSYNHASLANVTAKINEALSRHGLSASWKVQQNWAVSVTCRITHEQGHGEETTLTAPADTTGSKNAIQSIGSTISYLERYSLLALTGLATHEMDDDGKSVGSEFISPDEVKKIREEVAVLNIPIDTFLSYMEIDSLEVMLKTDLSKARVAIESSKANRAVRK